MAALTVQMLKNLTIVFLAIFVIQANARSLSTDEYLHLKKHLRSLNKPAVKSLQIEDGEIYDCVDIYKQPAFDHPALQNYTIPKIPTTLPLKRIASSPSNTSKRSTGIFVLPDGGCPEGTVPIRRVQMEDLLRAGSISNFGKKYVSNGGIGLNAGAPLPNTHHWARRESKPGGYYGTHVGISIWQPRIFSNEKASSSQVWLLAGAGDDLNGIEAGLAVNKQLFGDLKPRLFTYWTSDNYRKTGCFNLLCSGFVSVNQKIPLGFPMTPLSVRGGPQYSVGLDIYKDVAVWWLLVDDSVVGFWPQERFNRLNQKAEKILWGGEVYNPRGTSDWPQMGSGAYADQGYEAAAYMHQVMFSTDRKNYVDAPSDIGAFADNRCYSVGEVEFDGEDDVWRSYFYFGGPGGSC
ncbi:hypothetical protein H6P81_021001 [Aristolochia fimbriata]|uniref:Neprosin PEP catalytic domain-containing protein n=1 Tax=Aristolochia fimbriata TaxID=158543 RepID=A0AAV7DZ18_ARIFI|nr:hypothetical protein H6P81_021001 [Aristolochia fimbriata]